MTFIVTTTILGKVKYYAPPLFLLARMQRSTIENKDIGLGRCRQKQNVDMGIILFHWRNVKKRKPGDYNGIVYNISPRAYQRCFKEKTVVDTIVALTNISIYIFSITINSCKRCCKSLFNSVNSHQPTPSNTSNFQVRTCIDVGKSQFLLIKRMLSAKKKLLPSKTCQASSAYHFLNCIPLRCWGC